MSEQPLDPRLTALEAALAALAPQPARLDRDQLLYEAGRRSARGMRGWRLATACLACVVLVQAGVSLWRPAPAVIERFVALQPPPARPALTVAPSPPAERLVSVESEAVGTEAAEPWAEGARSGSLRDQVLRWGVDVIPDLPPAPALAPDAAWPAATPEGPQYLRLQSLLNLGGHP